MDYIYPRAAETKTEIIKLNKNIVAEAIIVEIEAGKTKGEMIGHILSGSDDVETFEQAYREVMIDKNKINSVSLKKTVVITDAVAGDPVKGIEPAAEVTEEKNKTATEYKSDLANSVTHIDPVRWFDGKLVESGVVKYSDLFKSKTTTEVKGL